MFLLKHYSSKLFDPLKQFNSANGHTWFVLKSHIVQSRGRQIKTEKKHCIIRNKIFWLEGSKQDLDGLYLGIFNLERSPIVATHGLGLLFFKSQKSCMLNVLLSALWLLRHCCNILLKLIAEAFCTLDFFLLPHLSNTFAGLYLLYSIA